MWRARKGKEGEKEPQEPVKSAGKSVGKIYFPNGKVRGKIRKTT